MSRDYSLSLFHCPIHPQRQNDKLVGGRSLSEMFPVHSTLTIPYNATSHLSSHLRNNVRFSQLFSDWHSLDFACSLPVSRLFVSRCFSLRLTRVLSPDVSILLSSHLNIPSHLQSCSGAGQRTLAGSGLLRGFDHPGNAFSRIYVSIQDRIINTLLDINFSIP